MFNELPFIFKFGSYQEALHLQLFRYYKFGVMLLCSYNHLFSNLKYSILTDYIFTAYHSLLVMYVTALSPFLTLLSALHPTPTGA